MKQINKTKRKNNQKNNKTEEETGKQFKKNSKKEKKIRPPMGRRLKTWFFLMKCYEKSMPQNEEKNPPLPSSSQKKLDPGPWRSHSALQASYLWCYGEKETSTTTQKREFWQKVPSAKGGREEDRSRHNLLGFVMVNRVWRRAGPGSIILFCCFWH